MAEKTDALQRVWIPGQDKPAWFPADMPQPEIEKVVRKHLGVPEPPPPSTAGQHEGVANIAKGAVLDTLGLSGRQGAVSLMGNEQTKTPLGVVLNPQGPLETATSMAVTAAPIAKAGTLAAKALPAIPKIAAAGGRMLAGTGLAAAKEIGKTGGVGWETVIDAAIEGGTEAVGATIGKYVKDAGKAARGFKAATEKPQKALDYVKSRLMNVKAIIPSIDPAKKLTWDEMIERLKGLTGEQYRVARAEIANVMNGFDRQALKPRAGQVFKDMTKPKRFPASSFSELAESTRKGATGTQAIADTAATTRDEQGVPAGFYAWEALKSGAGAVGEHVMGPALRAASKVMP